MKITIKRGYFGDRITVDGVEVHSLKFLLSNKRVRDYLKLLSIREPSPDLFSEDILTDNKCVLCDGSTLEFIGDSGYRVNDSPILPMGELFKHFPAVEDSLFKKFEGIFDSNSIVINCERFLEPFLVKFSQEVSKFVI